MIEQCSHCRHVVDLPQGFASSWAKCPACGRAFQVQAIANRIEKKVAKNRHASLCWSGLALMLFAGPICLLSFGMAEVVGVVGLVLLVVE
jgi:uncharacterized paraquat-inducible protein A